MGVMSATQSQVLAAATHYPGCLGLQILKDIINKYQLLQGRRVRYIPGWDCHGLPIELKAGLRFLAIYPHVTCRLE